MDGPLRRYHSNLKRSWSQQEGGWDVHAAMPPRACVPPLTSQPPSLLLVSLPGALIFISHLRHTLLLPTSLALTLFTLLSIQPLLFMSPVSHFTHLTPHRLDQDVFIIDQHAADEKRNFERLQVTAHF